ncbi:sulfotransferase 2B1-like isoform X1 [Ranitomeya imitator]|uniref:sulfotransferase 2B1-like isoform X1 n=1 Tax=Ranitomeya imitator TaxID=111125 RepID=UPI0037E91AF0
MTYNYFLYKGIRFTFDLFSEESIAYAENEFKVLDDDIYNVTFPKSGSTWMIEILNLIKHKGDVVKSSIVPSYNRSPWYEASVFAEIVKKMDSPRILSSHLPQHIFAKSFFESKAKIIYTIRNPRDVIASSFHYSKILNICEAVEDFEKFINDFLQGNVLFGSWFEHVKGWIKMKDDSRFFFVTYEELLQDLRGCVVRICKFLGQDLDDTQIDLVVEHSSFKAMKENVMSNWTQSELIDNSKGSFLRKGVAGDWKSLFTVAQSEYFDKIYEEKMKDVNVKFFWEESS